MVQTLVRSPPVAPPISIKLLPLPWPQDPFMYLHNAILMCENTQVHASNIYNTSGLEGFLLH